MPCFPAPLADCEAFLGIFCDQCRSYAVCWSCITQTHQSEAPELPPHLSHASSPGNDCPAAAWLLFLEAPETPAA